MKLLIVLVFLSAWLLALLVQASDPETTRQLPESVRRIEQETGGQVLAAERVHYNGQEVNRLKILTPDGRVRIVRDSPARDKLETSAGTRTEEKTEKHEENGN